MSPRKAKVGIVDDDEMEVKAARKALNKAGHKIVFEAGDLDTLETILKDTKEPPDVVLVDGSFPNSPGEGEEEMLGAYADSLIKDRFGDVTVTVMFSAREKNTFGQFRFPEPGEQKTLGKIENELGNFVTNLPPAAKR